MKHVLALCFFAGITSFGQITKKACFLGNSYTSVNDLPTLISSIAAADGNILVKDQNTPGGYTLMGHSTNATSLAKISSNNWDFVVLQDQSQMPSFPYAQVQADVYPYAEILSDLQMNVQFHYFTIPGDEETGTLNGTQLTLLIK